LGSLASPSPVGTRRRQERGGRGAQKSWCYFWVNLKTKTQS
jgi:hypothetical protein